MRRLLKAHHLLLFAVLIGAAVAMPAVTSAQVGVGVSITVAPPAIPVYEQPPCPTEGYMWTPGYWAYAPTGYYWVPGVWVAPPRVGFLWTPGYWGFAGGIYGWHAGYWGPHVGFYGGINYGFGYGGVGFVGGAWRGGAFAYNTAVWHVGGGFHNVYEDRTVIDETTHQRVSFNGEGGVRAVPTLKARLHARGACRPDFRIRSRTRGRGPGRPQQLCVGQPRHSGSSGRHGRERAAGSPAEPDQSGVKSGQLTPGETRHIENNETAIHNEAKTDRQENGGHLTGAEHNQIEHQQNRESRQIYNDKHNAKTDAHPHGGGGEKEKK